MELMLIVSSSGSHFVHILRGFARYQTLSYVRFYLRINEQTKDTSTPALNINIFRFSMRMMKSKEMVWMSKPNLL